MEKNPQPQSVPNADQTCPPKSKRVGITLITGPLGAGKSTLIHRILSENHNLRIVVVENEFADNATVEQAIVTQGLGLDALEGFIELPNGCICCAAQDDLTDALQRLLDKKRGKFDHILIEASGLADPGPVVASFWIDEGLDSDLYLDAVVTIIDAANVDRCLNTASTRLLLKKQLALADLVLLNKIDVIKESSEDNITSTLRKQGCMSQIIPTVKCDLDLRKLFGIRAYDSEATQRDILKIRETNHNDHDAFNSTTVNFSNVSFNPELLDRALGRLLWESQEIQEEENKELEIWRMKALVVINDEVYKRIYQSVHTLFDSTESALKSADDPVRQSKFIFIGKDLTPELLQRELEKALSTT
ncbi:Cobalamin synthesis protein cobW [Gracilaria domingensis]|nr:Cobalamin synthesis protein cobW [Gracilaria domingensis]